MAKSLLFRVKWFYREFLKDMDKLSDTTSKITFRLFTLGLIGHGCYTLKTTNNKIIIVHKKYKFSNNGFTEFMVIDQKGNHYNVTNSIWYWKWDSIEDWHKIQTNKKIIMKYYGWRIPLLGLFPNIVMSNQDNMLDSMSGTECRIMESELNKDRGIANIFKNN